MPISIAMNIHPNQREYGRISYTTTVRGRDRDVTLNSLEFEHSVQSAINMRKDLDEKLAPILEWRKHSLYQWAQRKTGKA